MREWTTEKLWEQLMITAHSPPEHAGPEPIIRGVVNELLRRERERCAAVADEWTAHDGREDESPAQVAAGIADRIRGLQ
jgi:hypothetical protein